MNYQKVVMFLIVFIIYKKLDRRKLLIEGIIEVEKLYGF